MEAAENIQSTLIALKNAYKSKLTFKRHHCDRYKRVKAAWRYPRGIDNRLRKQYSGMQQLPQIKFKKPSVIRNLLPNGMYEVIVQNLKDLNALISVNKRFCATIAHNVGARMRVQIVNQAQLYGITVTNAKARLMEAIEE